MRRALIGAWLVAGAGCVGDPAAAQQALVQADMCLVQKDYRAAIGLYDQVLATDPTVSEVYVHRAVAYRGNGNYQRSLADLDRAIEFAPENVRAYVERARTKLDLVAAQANGDKAKLAVALAPDDPYRIAADLDWAVQLDRMNLDGTALLLHGAIRIIQNRDVDAQKDFERFLLDRPRARGDLELAVERWKKDRPVLDLTTIDELGHRPRQRRF